MTRIALSAFLIALTNPALAQQNTAIQNEICSETPRGAEKLNLRRIGPLLEGTWTESAKGVIPAMGIQTSTVEVVYDRMRNRLYSSANGIMIELVPVRGGNKELRYDFINMVAMNPDYFVVDSELSEWAFVLGCDVGLAPQFSWQHGSGGQRSAGVTSFFSESEAIGTKWNTAGGAREVSLSKR